jgi:toxin ParE1/3/4
MSQRLIFRPEAQKDVAEAAEWYDQQSAGLSLRFRAALDNTLAAIEENPRLHPQVLRRALVRRFPFGIFYVPRTDGVIVVAVLHTARDPRLWRARFKVREG